MMFIDSAGHVIFGVVVVMVVSGVAVRPVCSASPTRRCAGGAPQHIGPSSFKIGRRVRYFRTEALRWIREHGADAA